MSARGLRPAPGAPLCSYSLRRVCRYSRHSRPVKQGSKPHNISQGITKKEYNSALQLSQQLGAPIVMSRRCFVQDDTHYKLDHVHAAGGIPERWLLTLESSREGEAVLQRVPKELQVLGEASGIHSSFLKLSRSFSRLQ